MAAHFLIVTEPEALMSNLNRAYVFPAPSNDRYPDLAASAQGKP